MRSSHNVSGEQENTRGGREGGADDYRMFDYLDHWYPVTDTERRHNEQLEIMRIEPGSGPDGSINWISILQHLDWT